MYRVTHGNLASGQTDLRQISTINCSITKQLATTVANTVGCCPKIIMPIQPIPPVQSRENEVNQYNINLAILKQKRESITRGNPSLIPCNNSHLRFQQYERRPLPPTNCFTPVITSGLPKAPPATCVNVVGIVYNNPPH